MVLIVLLTIMTSFASSIRCNYQSDWTNSPKEIFPSLLKSKLPMSAVEEVLTFALEGCRQVYDVLRSAVQIRMQEQLCSRGLINA